MANKFKDDLAKMYKQEVYPGQSVWAVKGLAEHVRKEGGIGLMAGVDAENMQGAAIHLRHILTSAALSTQDRFQLGIITEGSSCGTDLRTGGAGSVFTRLITSQMDKNFDSYPLSGNIQILYDLDLVERGGYNYTGDRAGTKESSLYAHRENIIELAKNCEKYQLDENEVCIQGAILPKFIKGVRVNTEEEKGELIEALKKEGLITKNEEGEDCINGILVDKFVRVGDCTADWWK